jgi:hypothetical protein
MCTFWLAELVNQFRYPPRTRGNSYDKEVLLVTYHISAGHLSFPTFEHVPAFLEAAQNDQDMHEAIWEYFSNLFPESAWQELASFAILTDGEDNLLAAVERSWNDPQKWGLSVDIVDAADMNELTSTLIHEFGHLVTLNVSQVALDEGGQNCLTYYTGDGCSLPGSYMADFFDRFWTDIFEEWNEIQYIEYEEEYDDAQDEFYWNYREQFVSDYAATSPDEDIAESWTLFILTQNPRAHTTRNQKILFFYAYPELVSLRESILSALCENIP